MEAVRPPAASARPQADLDLSISFSGVTSITNFAASPGVATGTIVLSWTEPDYKGITLPVLYDVRASTSGNMHDDGDFDAALPLSSFTVVSLPSPGGGGSSVNLTVPALDTSHQYCFAIREHDSSAPERFGPWIRGGNLNWNLSNCAYPTASIAAPTSLTASAGLEKTDLSWTAPSPLPADLAYYEIYRSTLSSSGFASLATTTATGFTDWIPAGPLTLPNTFYYYAVSVSTSGGQSQPTATASAAPDVLTPLEPLGVQSSSTTSSITLSWSKTTGFGDGTAFYDPSSPKPYELEGYDIYRSTSLCEANPPLLSSAPPATTSFTDSTGGKVYYYQVKSYNSVGISTTTAVYSSLGEVHFLLSDCITEMALTPTQASVLAAASNTYGGNVQIQRVFRPQDAGTGIIQSVQFIPMLEGKTPISNFHFSSPATIVVHFNVSGGGPAPLSASSLENLGLYWYDGTQYKKVYGEVDAAEQTVTVLSADPGIYQIRTIERAQSGPVFDVSNVYPRVITPNGDGLNDVLIAVYDPGPNNVVPVGEIFDLRGAHIADMVPGTAPSNSLVWDGKMDGRAVTSGVYVYRLSGDGKTFSGTVVVAR